MQHLGHAFDQEVDVEDFRIQRLAAREGEQALGQRGGPVGAADGAGGGALQPPRLRGQAAADDFEIAGKVVPVERTKKWWYGYRHLVFQNLMVHLG